MGLQMPRNGSESPFDVLMVRPADIDRHVALLKRNVVRRYGAYCGVWQVGNEPDGGGYFRASGKDYITYLEWTSQVIRAVQKQATIVAGELFRGEGVLDIACDRPVTVIGYDGRSSKWSPSGGKVRVKIGFCPQFIWLPDAGVGVSLRGG